MTKRLFARPRKRQIDLEEIGVFLRNIGFTVESVHQEWRHVTAFGAFEGKPAVFKLASTLRTNPKTEHEYLWNEAVHAAGNLQRLAIQVPKNFASGTYGKLFYFIADRYPMESIGARADTDTTPMVPVVPRIAQACFDIMRLDIPSSHPFVLRSNKSTSEESIGEQLL